jgi:hypothetical protein
MNMAGQREAAALGSSCGHSPESNVSDGKRQFGDGATQRKVRLRRSLKECSWKENGGRLEAEIIAINAMRQSRMLLQS